MVLLCGLSNTTKQQHLSKFCWKTTKAKKQNKNVPDSFDAGRIVALSVLLFTDSILEYSHQMLRDASKTVWPDLTEILQ